MSATGTRVEAYGVSDPGRARPTNEDQFLIGDLSKALMIQQTTLSRADHSRLHGDSQGKLLVVADGMGGMGGGRVASSVAVDALLGHVLNAMPWLFRLGESRDDDLTAELKRALVACAEAVRRAAAGDAALARMGTTFTMACVVWPRAYVVHVGDSRCYLLRRGGLHQVSRDQTLAQRMADEKVISEQEAAASKWRNVLWSALGGGTEELQAEVYKLLLEAGDVLLLCTDGLVKHVSDAQLEAELVAAPSPEAACRRLLGLANEGGGSDNVTVVVAAIR